MELIRFLTETIIEWVRDIAVNLSGRIAEDFVGRRVNRRRRVTKRRRKRRRKSRETRMSPTIPSRKHSP